MSDFQKRLEEFLDRRNESSKFDQLTPDASTREYFRVEWKDGTAIACVYPEPFVAAEQSYLDVSKLFASNGLPVAAVYDYDESLGIIVQEDLGDTILRDVLLESSNDKREKLIDEAIAIIAMIQLATRNAYETGSIASKLKFDVEKLLWELDFFQAHYFGTFMKRPLSDSDAAALQAEFKELAEELEARATVLCHRDFHAANIMVDQKGSLLIIDHQDARIGSAAYDLVSLVLDRITELPSAEWLAQKRRLLIEERIKLGLERLDEPDFTYEFRLQTIQRCLKAVGTFSFQSANRGKTHFIPFIKPMFEIVMRALQQLDKFPVIQTVVEKEIDSSRV
jgi:aminoglycoside/choline kinase family phosphotransferase